MSRTIETHSPEQTARFGAALGRVLSRGDVVGLRGDLGAGKTHLVRGMAAGLDLDPDVIYSPTFTLVAEHDGRRGRLNHIDLFRLASSEARGDEEEIGLADYLAPEGITVVEWCERLGGKSAWTLEIDIEVGAGDERRLTLRGEGERAAAILRALEHDSSWR